LPQLGSPGFPSFFVLAKFRIGQISSLKEQTASLVFNGLIEHLLQGSIGLRRHFCEAAVRRATDPDRCWQTNMYTQAYAESSTGKDRAPKCEVKPVALFAFNDELLP
jgi:hypothetical protein